MCASDVITLLLEILKATKRLLDSFRALFSGKRNETGLNEDWTYWKMMTVRRLHSSCFLRSCESDLMCVNDEGEEMHHIPIGSQFRGRCQLPEQWPPSAAAAAMTMTISRWSLRWTSDDVADNTAQQYIRTPLLLYYDWGQLSFAKTKV